MKTNYDLTTQQGVNPGIGTGNASATLAAYGGGVKSPAPRGFFSNVDRTFKATFDNGSRAYINCMAGQDRPHSIVGISAASGTAISSASKLIYPIY